MFIQSKHLLTHAPLMHQSWSGFTIYLVPISILLQWSVWSVWPQPVWRLQAGFSLTLLWPGFHFPPEAASPTVTGVDKQVDIAAIVAPGATTNLREGGGAGEGKGEKDGAQADWQEPLTQLYWSHENQCCFFSPLLVWLISESVYSLTEYWILLYTGAHLQNPTMNGSDEWEESQGKKTERERKILLRPLLLTGFLHGFRHGKSLQFTEWEKCGAAITTLVVIVLTFLTGNSISTNKRCKVLLATALVNS